MMPSIAGKCFSEYLELFPKTFDRRKLFHWALIAPHRHKKQAFECWYYGQILSCGSVFNCTEETCNCGYEWRRGVYIVYMRLLQHFNQLVIAIKF